MGKRWARQQAKENELAVAVERGTVWLRMHPQQATWTALGLVAALLVGVGFYTRHLAAKEEAWSKLAVATSYAYMGRGPEALKQVEALGSEHAASSASQYGMLLTGDLLYDQGNYPAAADSYRKVAERNADAHLLPLALAGLTLSLEAGGDCKTASGDSQRFLDSYQDHYLAPQVHASMARCLIALGERDRAKATFERMEFLYPNSYWSEWAKARKG
jgi:tetratricopeptide (TPR) repeat protein